MAFRGCWSCGSHAACYVDCDCAKCIDPEGYKDWKMNNPDSYERWIERQELDHDNDCDCPGCV